METGETLEVCVAREVKEETGLDVNHPALYYVSLSGYLQNLSYFYLSIPKSFIIIIYA
ncbi:NUDIX domain-containing protein [Bacteroides xylanisolvens]|uniref:NUDIX domain-containing protein n=1 Tax=Bacteroides xylanisolvens TaxID=371601 RepID=UPI0021CFA481|nr:NUDIX domain-containing protein [Bacteroides xylanisolvens]